VWQGKVFCTFKERKELGFIVIQIPDKEVKKNFVSILFIFNSRQIKNVNAIQRQIS